MSTLTHCPKCGSDFKCEFLGAKHYECGSTENESGSYWESHGCLQNQLAACKAEAAQMIEQLSCDVEGLKTLSQIQAKKVQESCEENIRLRAALAQSPGACHYCQLPKEQWALCKSGFPGCGRLDDALGCPELGASMGYNELLDKCAIVVHAWRDLSPNHDAVNSSIESLANAIGYKDDAK